MKRKIFTNEQVQEIILLYLNNYTLKSIGSKFLCDRSVIKRILLENNVALRSTTKKYPSQDDIFETIDTIEKAYWLGFIAADGCNYSREHNASIIINLNTKDKEHLQKFKIFCNSAAEIQDYISSEGFSNLTPMSKIIINSKKMSADLSDKGIVSQKSLFLKPPKISQEFYLPFILGYFDGDGSISKTTQYNNYSLSFVGTKEILEWINNLLNISSHLEKRNNDEKNNYYIRCGGTNKPYYILKLLYDACPIHLERKYEIYKTLETVVLSRNAK